MFRRKFTDYLVQHLKDGENKDMFILAPKVTFNFVLHAIICPSRQSTQFQGASLIILTSF
jgi:hypothetical protein